MIYPHDLAIRLFDGLLESSWQASVLAGLVLAARWVFRRSLPSRWCYLLWMVVIGRLLLPALPESPASVYRYIPASQFQALVEKDWVRWMSPVRSEIGAAGGNGEVSTLAGSPPGAFADSASMSKKEVAVLVWLLGASLLAGLLVLRTALFHRSLANEGKPATKEVELLAGRIAKDLGMTYSGPIRETSLMTSPAVVGLFHPTLLLPAGIASRLTDDELQMVLRHELAHLKRGDLWMNFVATALQIVHWFNPLLWFTFACMRQDREMATDALAISSSRSNSPFAYGQMLLKLAVHYPPSRGMALSAGILETHQNLKRRLEQIIEVRPNAYAWSTPGLGLIIVLATVGLTRASVPAVLGNETTITSDSMKREADKSEVFAGRVLVQYPDIHIRADGLRLELTPGLATATGNVRVTLQKSGAPTSTGAITITADGSNNYKGQVATADGNVTFGAGAVKILADHANYDRSTRTLQASGHVQVIDGKQVFRSDSITYELAANTVASSKLIWEMAASGPGE